MDALQKNGGSLGGLLSGQGLKQTKENAAGAESCLDSVLDARAEYNSITASDSNAAASKKFAKAVDHANRALKSARSAGLKPNITSFKMATYTNAVDGTESVKGYHYTDADKDRILEIVEDIKRAGGNHCGENCGAELAKVEAILNETPTSTSDRGSLVTRYLKNARYECNEKKENEGSCKDITIPSLSLVAVEEKEITGGSAGSNLQDDDYYKTTFLSDLGTLEKACQEAGKGESDADRQKRRNNNLIAGAVGTAVGSALGAGITASVLKAKYEKAENK